jgi:hypothetical protein
VGPALWSPDDCAWATRVLTTDTQLDHAEVTAIENGSDTRWGNGPEVIAYYQRYVTEWSTVLGEVQGWCSDTAVPIDSGQRGRALSWFADATAAHQYDTQARPENASWNASWIANYARLTGLFSS